MNANYIDASLGSNTEAMTTYYVAVLLLALVSPAALQDNWLSSSFQEFIQNQSDGVKSFFDEQKSKVENMVSSSVDMSNSVNNLIDNVKETGRKVADTFSYLPDDSEPTADNPDVRLSVSGIIARHGYQCETHTVVSKGYILSIHRIPHSKNGSNTPSKTILLQHGLFGSSADWILNGPDKSLAYVLADAGYDVWMSNIRGNRYSREHENWNTDSKAFWNFSWHDVALYDIPAVINYIIGVKGPGTRIAYMGHSMGTTILFSMLTLRPEYNQILTAGFALAPIVFFKHMKSPIQTLAPIASNVAYMEMMYGSHEFIPKNSAMGKMSSSCSADNIDAALCKNVVFYICGYNEKQFNKTLLPVFLSHLGTGTSWKTAVHFAQEIVSGSFQKFDYGTDDNLRVYGSDTPPEYDLSKVTLPIKLFWSRNDLLSSEEDIRLLESRLPGEVDTYMVPDPEFNHLDYLWAIDAPKLLNDNVVYSFNKIFKHQSYNRK